MDKLRKIPLSFIYAEAFARCQKKVRELTVECKDIKAEENTKSVFECIRELKGVNGSLVVDFEGDMRVPLNDKDKVAIDALDYLIGKYNALSVADIHQICDFMKFYMEFSQIIDYNKCQVHCDE